MFPASVPPCSTVRHLPYLDFSSIQQVGLSRMSLVEEELPGVGNGEYKMQNV